MERIEIVNVYDHLIVVNVKIATLNSRRISIVGGHIYMTLTKNYSLLDIKRILETYLDLKKIQSLYSKPYYDSHYVDVLGIRRRLVVLSRGQNRISKEDFVIEKEADLSKKLKQLELDILKSRVEKYSQLMNIPVKYQVKVTTMRSAVGKNYYTKNLLTFDRILIHYSLEIIDSVVIHELAHYYIQNHSKDFYQIIYKYMPNYRKVKKKLISGVRE